MRSHNLIEESFKYKMQTRPTDFSRVLYGSQWWESLLLAHDQLLMLVRNVPFDLALVNEIGQDALRLVRIDVFDLIHSQGN